MSEDELDRAGLAAGEGPSEADVYTRVAVLESALARLDIAAGARPDLPVAVAALDVGLAGSELEVARTAGEGAVALIHLGACPDDLDLARDQVVEALSALLGRIERSLAGEDVPVGCLAAEVRALVHLRHAVAVLTPRP